MLKFERRAYGEGKCLIAGVDEAGRGSLAGPVVAGAVVLPRITDLKDFPPFFSEIKDSKKLTPKKREEIYRLMLQEKSVSIGIGIVEEGVIDRVNILNATFMAMKKAVANLPVTPEIVFVDGVPIPEFEMPQTAIVGGDNLSISIAAGSIAAKVVRDSIMVSYAGAYPGYGFKEHKGYGTKLHFENLMKLGPCRIHRKSFEPVRQAEESGVFRG